MIVLVSIAVSITAADCGYYLAPDGFAYRMVRASDTAALEAELAEVQGERDEYLFALTEYLMACPPDYQESCDARHYDDCSGMVHCAEQVVGCWKRWAKKQAAAEGGEDDGRCC